MKTTVYYPDGVKIRHINIQMADEFNEAVIKKKARQIVRDRWPELLPKIKKIEWRYE